MFIDRWRRAIFTRRKIDFVDSGVRFEGLPHVGSLGDGTWVYSRMPVLRSTSKELVFRNGSWVKSSPVLIPRLNYPSFFVIITDVLTNYFENSARRKLLEATIRAEVTELHNKGAK
jgi:hypothetical protein